MVPFTSTGSGEYPFHRKLGELIGAAEIRVVRFPSLIKSVTGLKWMRAWLQMPSWQGTRGRSTRQEDRDTSAPCRPSPLPSTGRNGRAKTVRIRIRLNSLLSLLLTFTAGAKLQRQGAVSSCGERCLTQAQQRNCALHHKLIQLSVLPNAADLWSQLWEKH